MQLIIESFKKIINLLTPPWTLNGSKNHHITTILIHPFMLKLESQNNQKSTKNYKIINNFGAQKAVKILDFLMMRNLE